MNTVHELYLSYSLVHSAARITLRLMTNTLITGANKGLGYEAARRLIAQGHTVFLGARDREKGETAAQKLGARFVQLDVTDDASVSAAAAWLGQQPGGLDVLINNAGIAGGRIAPPDVTADELRAVYETNVFGIVRVTHAVLPLLRASANPVIVNRPEPLRVASPRARLRLVEIRRRHAHRAIRESLARRAHQRR
jgi:NAD(P)-dependent dehydrogenase (short-subunit alcohol dehydrogenase family)